jgi:hypothetical protein
VTSWTVRFWLRISISISDCVYLLTKYSVFVTLIVESPKLVYYICWFTMIILSGSPIWLSWLQLATLLSQFLLWFLYNCLIRASGFRCTTSNQLQLWLAWSVWNQLELSYLILDSSNELGFCVVPDQTDLFHVFQSMNSGSSHHCLHSEVILT